MTELHIQHFWSADRKCNVFGVRGQSGDLYNALYADLSTPPQTERHVKPRPNYRSFWTLESDFPWHYFTFYDEAEAAAFLEKWSAYVYTPTDFEQPRKWQRPENPESHTWCERCRVFHEKQPEGYDLESELSKQLSAEIAAEIDQEILNELLALAKDIK